MGKLVNLSDKENATTEDGQESLEENTIGKYESLGKKIGSLVDSKNAAYGNSFDQAGDFLRLLYPNGIKPEQYGDMLCVVRIFDKLKRIATQKDAFAESPYQDIVGYGLLGTERDMRIQKNIAAQEQTGQVHEVSTTTTVAAATNTDTHTPANNSLSQPKEDSEPLVPVSCSVCGGYVTSVKKSLSQNLFVHETCFGKANSQ